MIIAAQLLQSSPMFMNNCCLIAIISVLFSCNTTSRNGHGDTDTANGNPSNPPVETRKPNADYKPAFTGQTRVAGVKTTTPYEGRVINNDLERPWGKDVRHDAVVEVRRLQELRKPSFTCQRVRGAHI